MDIDTAPFNFAAHDCRLGADGQPTITEAFGYYSLPGHEHDNDVLQTGAFEAPAGSPIAQAAHQAAVDPGIQTVVAAILRSNIDRCPCATATTCPALDARHLLLALCRATCSHPATQHNAAPCSPDRPEPGHLIIADCPWSAWPLTYWLKPSTRSSEPLLLQSPVTASDVAGLCQRRQLRYIRHLGPRRTGEIELVLILVGL